jgi:uncharacterized repeat protein (TIGR03847 family)
LSRSFDLDPADRFTAGAVGEPGQRTFFVQARNKQEFLTLLCEKQQVFLLARELQRVLAMLPDENGEAEQVPAYDLELVEPLEPEWRIGSMSIEFDPERDRIIVLFRELDEEAMNQAAEEVLEAMESGELEALVAEEEPEDADDEDEDEDRFIGDAIARLVVTRGQVRAMAEHAMDVVAAGRPRCPVCGEAMEPDVPHNCIGMNGHGKH